MDYRPLRLAATLAGLALVTACSGLLSLSPETAASRIASYGGYRDEACTYMQSYVENLNAMNWETPGPVAAKSTTELAALIGIFARDPEVTCEVMGGGARYKLNGRRFYQLLSVYQLVEPEYRRLGDTPLSQCTD